MCLRCMDLMYAQKRQSEFSISPTTVNTFCRRWEDWFWSAVITVITASLWDWLVNYMKGIWKWWKSSRDFPSALPFLRLVSLKVFHATHTMQFLVMTSCWNVQSFPKETQLFSVDFPGAQGQGHVTWGHEKSAYRFSITPDSLVYTLLQKKGNFRNVAFLLEKTVAWLADVHCLICCIVLIWRQIAKMFSTVSLWGSLFLMRKSLTNWALLDSDWQPICGRKVSKEVSRGFQLFALITSFHKNSSYIWIEKVVA